MQQEIIASAPHALQVLASCLSHNGEKQSDMPLCVLEQILGCAGSDIADSQHHVNFAFAACM